MEKRNDPIGQVFTIHNLGYGDDLSWMISGANDWLILDKIQGTIDHTTQDIITASVDITGLSHGTYSCELLISDHNAMNSPQTVQV